MDINSITSVVTPRSRGEIPAILPGDAWLGGGTWLFSEPQPDLRRMIDLTTLGWEPIVASRDGGLEIAATCTIAELAGLAAESRWPAAVLMDQCCRALLGSFKIWNTATVGGNICMALPAGPMIALAVALEAVGTIWRMGEEDGAGECRIVDFVTGAQSNALAKGELLRSIYVPEAALRRRHAFRQISLNPFGRSGALLIGTRDEKDGGFWLTVTAATRRPIRLAFPHVPDGPELLDAIAHAIPDDLYYDDIHGRPDWRRHVTRYLAQSIRDELSSEASA